MNNSSTFGEISLKDLTPLQYLGLLNMMGLPLKTQFFLMSIPLAERDELLLGAVRLLKIMKNK